MSKLPMSFYVATDFFSTLYRGEHHIPGGQVKEHGQGWCVNDTGHMATYDFDFLTRLVFLAHDRCIRTEVLPSGPGRVKIAIWQRHKREGSISERHPTIETALADWRKRHPEPAPLHTGDGISDNPVSTMNTDDADTDVVLQGIQQCAQAWVPDVRIIGNVRAGDITRAITAALAEREELRAENERLRACLGRYAAAFVTCEYSDYPHGRGFVVHEHCEKWEQEALNIAKGDK